MVVFKISNHRLDAIFALILSNSQLKGYCLTYIGRGQAKPV
jgi:hypothetical protein